MMADQRTMSQLLQAPTEGYEDAIVVLAITADNFELKHGLLTLVQNKHFFGHDKEDPHAHIRYFNKITSTLKFPNVPNTETWDRFKDFLRACPHHGFSELHQLDTFYNALNSKDQDSLNSAAGGNFFDKMPRECLAIIESKSKVRYSCNKPVVAKVSTNTSTSGISPDVAELKDMVKALLLDKKSKNQAPATVKVVKESCVTCGGAHSYRNCPAIDGNIYRDNIQEFVSQASSVNYNQGNTSYRPPMMSNQIRPPSFPPVPNNQNVQLNQKNNQNRFIQNQNRGNNFNQGPVYQPPVFQPLAYQAPAPQTQGVSKEDFSAYVKANDAFVNSNNASTSGSSTLPSNTIANPRSDLKAITNRSGVSYDGPQVPSPPSFLPKVMKNEPEATKETVHPTNNGSTEDVQPQVVQSKSLILTSEPVNSLVSAPRPNLRPSIPYPSRLQDQKLRDKANDQREKFFQIFKDLNFNISFNDALILMPKFGPSIKSLLNNKDKLSELARTPLNEHCSAVLLKKLPEKLGETGKFLIPCDFPEKAECLALADLGAIIWKRILKKKTKTRPKTTKTKHGMEKIEKDKVIRSRKSKVKGRASPVIVEPLRIELPFIEDQFQEDPPPEVPMADNRTMAELLQAPTEGYEDAIVIPKIAANNFELKHGLINLVQNKHFFGHDKEDPHAHIRYFNKITSTMRVPNVPSSSIKLMLFPFSLEGICLGHVHIMDFPSCINSTHSIMP
nr:hypothetical protein [Tanacetum cinerariifolium]